MTLCEERVKRILDAVQMKKVDKIPCSFNGPAYIAREQGMTIAEFVSNYPAATSATIDFCKAHPGVDTIHQPTLSPYVLQLLWLSELKVPGVELPENELWQIHEKEKMTPDDYELIAKNGYGPWLNEYLRTRVGNPLPKIMPFIASSGDTARRVITEGQVMPLNGAAIGSPIECFCGGRQMMNFFVDMIEEPELVKPALDEAFHFLAGIYCFMLDAIRPFGAWVGGWRAAPQLLSHDMWMEFVWPYLKKLIELTLEHGVLPVLHFDSCWDSEIETLRELPPRSCILMLDGSTDIRRARSILGDHMAIMGDVPSQLLAYASAEEVYEYTTKLIDDVGHDTGLIISSGCDCPMNARRENVDAMIQATVDYLPGQLFV